MTGFLRYNTPHPHNHNHTTQIDINTLYPLPRIPKTAYPPFSNLVWHS